MLSVGCKRQSPKGEIKVGNLEIYNFCAVHGNFPKTSCCIAYVQMDWIC